MRLPAFRAVIFDMDGLVLDSEPTYAFAWKQAAAEFDVHLADDFLHGLFGHHAEHVERELARKIGRRFEAAAFRRKAVRHWWAHVESHGIPPMPGVREMLDLLERNSIPFALATNSEAIYARECLRRGGMEHSFSIVVTRDQVAAGKPEPDLFLEAARRMAIPAGKCLVMEDSAPGLLAARRAGAVPVLVQARPAADDSVALAFVSYRSLTEAGEDMRSLLTLESNNQPNLRRSS